MRVSLTRASARIQRLGDSTEQWRRGSVLALRVVAAHVSSVELHAIGQRNDHLVVVVVPELVGHDSVVGHFYLQTDTKNTVKPCIQERDINQLEDKAP